ncbi:MAG: hypothetical protein M3295_01205 [Chloroflexota bacterium]|nr:hypothetical protein [Chloroflexota bacterium]
MEVASFVYSAGVGIGLLLIGIATLVLVVAGLPLIGETRRLVTDLRRLAGLADAELRPTLERLRETATRLDGATGELPPRLERLDVLMENADATLTSVRTASDMVARYAGVPGAGIATVAAGLRRARDVFGRGRSGGASVESGPNTEDPGR